MFTKGATKVYLSRYFIDIDDAEPSGKVGTSPGTATAPTCSTSTWRT